MNDKTNFVHLSPSEVREGILDHQVEKCPTCDGPLEDGFGLAGGGFGPYGYCEACEKVVYKINLSDDWA